MAGRVWHFDSANHLHQNEDISPEHAPLWSLSSTFFFQRPAQMDWRTTKCRQHLRSAQLQRFSDRTNTLLARIRHCNVTHQHAVYNAQQLCANTSCLILERHDMLCKSTSGAALHRLCLVLCKKASKASVMTDHLYSNIAWSLYKSGLW